MPKIIHMELKRGRPERFIVHWDNGDITPFSPDTVLRYQFSIDREFDEEELKPIFFEDEVRRAKDQILRYLAVRPHSRSELFSKTIRKGYPPEAIDQALNDLEQVKLIDDRQFAEQFIRTEMLLRPSSKRLLREKLLSRGVKRELVEELLETLCPPQSQEEALLYLIQKFWKANQRYQTKKRLEKLIRYLQGKGFDWDLIQWGIQELNLREEE
ncbi:MAG: regulatory protein RecX [Calditrichaeota bacterium]|nr:MAG: regulatory protein RecX [Calditrichota bacterium]